MERIRSLVFVAATSAVSLLSGIAFGQGESVPGRVPPGGIERLPGGAPTDPMAEENKLPPFDMGKFCYALGLDAARTAKAQKTEIDTVEMRKGITDGLAGSGPSVSYTYGLDLGRRMKEFNVTPDLEQYIAAVEDVAAGREPAVDAKDAAVQMELFERRLKEQREREHLKQSTDFLEKNATRPGVVVVDTGWGKLQYVVIKEGAAGGAKLKDGDRVRFHYTGNLLDESEWRPFTSSRIGDDPMPLEVLLGTQGLVKGLELGLKQMTVGSTYRFFLPPELGFGKEGASQIPPNTVLTFDVEVLGFAESDLKGTGFSEGK